MVECSLADLILPLADSTNMESILYSFENVCSKGWVWMVMQAGSPAVSAAARHVVSLSVPTSFLFREAT